MPATTVKFRIPGTKQTEATKIDWETKQLKISNVRTYTLAAVRGEAGEPSVEITQPGDVVEVELENGLRFWTSPQRLRDEVFAELGVKRGAADEAFDIPMQLPHAGADRGLGGVVIKVLRFFTPDVTAFAADKLAKIIEDHGLEKGAGTKLYRCETSGDDIQLTPVASGDIPADKKTLLLLHGTGSSTRGSFGELWSDKGSDWARRTSWLNLLKSYGTVLALEHRSLTENPVTNLITLLESLPAGMSLHVMSHSRGGMVGEMLCRGGATDGQAPFSEAELACFLKADPRRLRGDLDKLNKLLQEKRITVERFVRTACPVRGTTLASGRLDLYFSVLHTLLSLVPGVVSSVIDGLAELAAGIAHERIDPSVLPGIEAMIPDSPLVKLLNNPTAKVQGRLRVISGDIKAGSLFSTFSVLLTQPLFESEHDLVVNTDSMYAGAARADGAAYVFYQGSEINHFHYFTNRASVEKLEAALSAQETAGDGFTPYRIAGQVDPVVTRGAPDARPRHTVFLLPGSMGSHLAIQEHRVWMDFAELSIGGMGRLRFDQVGVKEDALVGQAYGDMVDSLSGGFNVVPFPYDWRLSVKQSAARLSAAIEAKLDELDKTPGGLPVSIVAHSMGGIVARAMIAFYPDTWTRLCRHKEARLVMLGVPNGGSHAMGMVLTGQDGLMRRLAMLDFKHDLKELLDIVREFPGVAELLPDELLSPDRWATLRNGARNGEWTPPDAAILAAARVVRDEIAQVRLDAERVYYIAGNAPATPCGVDLAADDDDVMQVVFQATPRGDGRVTWESGIPEKVRTWYADALHGDLCKPEKCCAAVIDILRNGDTNQLSKVALSTRGVPDAFAMPLERSILHPNYEELLAAALCATPKRISAASTAKIKVRVVHGSLEFANYPILVGHYQGDTLVSAEADLDRHLDGRLRNAHHLGLYPGEANTAQVFLSDKHQPKGAIVVGLGEVGKLTPGALEATVSRGISAYATSLADCHGNRLEGQRGISVLLVGTNGAGVSVSTAVAAILRGIDKALLNLEKHHLADRLALEEVELVEIYQDRAIQAAHALWDAARDDILARRFEFDATPLVICRRGAKQRAFCEDTPDWWQRLVIIEDECGGLTFNVITDRARMESYFQPSQRNLVNELIEDALANPSPENLAASTLFQMLTPNNLKQYAPDQHNLLLVLNEASARYPWELMTDNTATRKGGSSDPLSVRGGMVRQLQTGIFREKVLHATEKNVLVIGHPNLPTDKFHLLPGAVKEAHDVEKKLSSFNYNVTAVVEKDASSIMKALHGNDYLILHLSGHGVYQHKPPVEKDSKCDKELALISGMVIGDEIFLTPAEIRQMTTVPELAFINCCHLGKIEDRSEDFHTPNLPALAANLGAELIRMGVRAVVAAGWAVNDDGARLFATMFYEAMLSGKNFGYAVHEARKAVYVAYPQNNTWGAYQCYGDQSYVLGNGGGDPKLDAWDSRFVHPGEVVVALDNITVEAATLQECDLESRKDRVQAIYDTLPPKWLELGEILAAMGRVWGELREFGKAVNFYEEARIADNAEMSLKAVEQLCNLRARLAVEINDVNHPEKAMELLNLAQEEAETLLKIGETFERQIMLGSVFKRRALVEAKLVSGGGAQGVTSTEPLKASLGEMRDCYSAASKLYGEKNQGKVYPYPLLYSQASNILLAMLNQRKPGGAALKKQLQKARDTGRERDQETPCFWDAIAVAESDLLEGLAGCASASTTKTIGTIWVDKVAQGYLLAVKRDGSPRETSSVLEHLEFLATVAEAAQYIEAAAALRAIKKKIA